MKAGELWLQVETLAGSERWSYVPIPLGRESSLQGWGWVQGLADKQMEDLLVAEECSLAFVASTVCVVVDQDYLAADCGDSACETTGEVIERLKEGLLPALHKLVGSIPGAWVGVGHGRHLRHGRPTVLVAVPAGAADARVLEAVVRCIQDHAFA